MQSRKVADDGVDINNLILFNNIFSLCKGAKPNLSWYLSWYIYTYFTFFLVNIYSYLKDAHDSYSRTKTIM